MVGVWCLASGVRFYLDAFGRNLVSVVVKMFSHSLSVLFEKKVLMSNGLSSVPIEEKVLRIISEVYFCT